MRCNQLVVASCRWLSRRNSKKVVNFSFVFVALSLVWATAAGFSPPKNPDADNLGAVRQGITVSGTVSDEKEPLPGVSIFVKGTLQGVVSDINGRYVITVPNRESVLVFSFVGYTVQEIIVGDRRAIDVTLAEEIRELDEVVVIGYGSQSKASQTAAISTVTTEDLLKRQVPNVGNMLIGQVTGVSAVQTTGLPGGDDPRLFVRGVGTLNSDDATPLILVDGMERSFYQLDPNEIESISVLKDASATAVFGVKGANGVLIVTTKRGSEGAPKVSVSLSTGVDISLRVLDFCDSYNWFRAYNEKEGKDVITDDLLDKFKKQEQPLLYPSHNWVKELTKPFTWHTQNNINVSGGTNIIKYFASLGYLSQEGMFKKISTKIHQNFNYNRFNYRTNFDITPTKSTKLGVSIGGVSGNREEPIYGNNAAENIFTDIYWAPPWSSAGIVDGKYVRVNEQYLSPDIPQIRDPFQQWWGNGNRTVNTSELNLDISFEQGLDMILRGLSADVKYSYNTKYTHTKNRTYGVPTYTPWEIGMTSDWRDVDPDADPTEVVLITNGGESLWGYNENYGGRNRKYEWKGALRYNRIFGNHQVTGLFLGQMSKEYYLDSNKYNYVNIPLGSLGFVWRATYNYSQKYLAEFNAGYNGSENFAPGKRFGFFPSISGGWTMSEEDFMKNVSFISFLKIRASVGKVGRDNIKNNRFLWYPDVWNASTGTYFFGATGANNSWQTLDGAWEKTIGNPNVTWETTVKQNYGIDVNFFKSRLSVNFDRFFEKRKDILSKPNTTPVYVALNLPNMNIGKVNNQGFEVMLKWKDQLGNDRKNSYYIGGTVSYSRNVVVYKDEVKREYPWQQETGHRVDQIFGYKFERLYRADDFPEALQYNDLLKPGDAKYTDLNKDNEISDFDKTAIGYSKNPDYVFSANMGFSYKGFDFTMLWQGATHVSKNLSNIYRIPFADNGGRSLMQYHYDRRYVSEELTPNAIYPRFSKDTRSWNYTGPNTNSQWVKDASYIRLKNVELGYRVSAAFVKKLGMNNFRIFLNGTNLLTFDDIVFIDPEETGNNRQYPNQATINLGINFNF